MNRIVLVVVILAALAWWLMSSRSPYVTLLPSTPDGLVAVNDQLLRLEPDERRLVEAYMQRSRGDVLPAQFADPDQPFTARTFAEAIELERRWQAKMAADRGVQRDRLAAREAQLAPLRAALTVKLVGRELRDHDQVFGAETTAMAKRAQPAGSTASLDNIPVLTYRVQNTSGRTIQSFRALVEIAGANGQLGLGSAASCYIERQVPLPAQGSHEISCRAPSPQSDQDRAVLMAPLSSIKLDWQPRDVIFADGTRLAGPG